MNTWYAKTINKDSAHEQGLIIDENTGANIAITLDPKDAILAAAAPELLEALKLFVDVAQWAIIPLEAVEYKETPAQLRGAIETARAAILKTEG